MDNGGIIKIPNGHVWIECDHDGAREFDSLTTFGPISSKYVKGKALYTIWPVWRFSNFKDIEKFNIIL